MPSNKYRLPKPKWWFSWAELLQPLAAEDIISGGYHRYMREVLEKDLNNKLGKTQDELDKLLILEVLLKLTLRDKTDSHAVYKVEYRRLSRNHKS